MYTWKTKSKTLTNSPVRSSRKRASLPSKRKTGPAETQETSHSGAQVFGVEGAGYGWIVCAFNDGAAIREDGEFVGQYLEAQEKTVLAKAGDGRREALLKGLQVQRAMMFVDLDGITATHGDVWLCCAMKIGELAANTGAAVGRALGEDGLKASRPNVGGDQTAMKRGVISGQKLKGFGSFEGSDEIDDRAKNANGVASFFHSERERSIHEAGEAGSVAGSNGHSQTITGHGRGINPGSGRIDREIVDQEASFEIISAIEDQRKVRKKFSRILGVKVSDDSFHLDIRIDGAEPALRCGGFGKRVARVGLFEEGLALQVGGLDKIAVDDAEMTDASTDKQIGGGRTYGAAADKHGAGGKKAVLTGLTNARKEHLAGVLFGQRTGHVK